jgi:hypothetical protein
MGTARAHTHTHTRMAAPVQHPQYAAYAEAHPGPYNYPLFKPSSRELRSTHTGFKRPLLSPSQFARYADLADGGFSLAAGSVITIDLFVEQSAGQLALKDESDASLWAAAEWFTPRWDGPSNELLIVPHQGFDLIKWKREVRSAARRFPYSFTHTGRSSITQPSIDGDGWNTIHVIVLMKYNGLFIKIGHISLTVHQRPDERLYLNYFVNYFKTDKGLEGWHKSAIMRHVDATGLMTSALYWLVKSIDISYYAPIRLHAFNLIRDGDPKRQKQLEAHYADLGFEPIGESDANGCDMSAEIAEFLVTTARIVRGRHRFDFDNTHAMTTRRKPMEEEE